MATIAVFLALGGGAYAALKLPKNSVGPKQIKAGAVGSAEVKNNKLTGKDILERRLETVPNANHALQADRAAEANHAANADLLGGNAAGAFVQADRLLGARTTAHWVSDGSESGERTEPILTRGPFSLTLSCRYAVNTQARVLVTTTAANSSWTRAGDGAVFGPVSGPQQLVAATVPSGGPYYATNGTPFSLYSSTDGTYLTGYLTVFAQDDGKECRSLLSALVG
jgi:hypothetical protein